MEFTAEQNAHALAQLTALAAVPGALQIITNERADPNVDPKKASAWVIHDVTHLEGPDERGYVVAHSAEGDYCMGEPVALLARLTEAGREQVSPGRERA